MSVTIEKVRTLNDNKVLVAQAYKNKNSESVKYYSVPEEKCDKFLKEQQGRYTHQGLQNFLSAGLALITGMWVSAAVKSSTLVKTIAGAATTVATFYAALAFDKWADNFLEKQNIKEAEAQVVDENGTSLEKSI